MKSNGVPYQAKKQNPLNTALSVYKPARDTKAHYRIVYGGSGSGKSVFIAMDEMDRAWNDPRQRILVLRKVGKTLRHSCFQLFLDVLRDTNRLGLTKVNRTEMTLTFPGGGQIISAGLDDVAKLKSITGVTRIWIEEATELDFIEGHDREPDLAQIDLRLRGVDPDLVPQITLTFNPSLAAVKILEYVQFPTADLPSRSFVERGDVYIQHTTHLDNRHVGDDYVRVFRHLGGVMQAVYERGELCAIDAPDQLIRYEWVKRAFEMDAEDATHDGRQRLACDVARFGDDETVIGRFEGWALVHTEAYLGQDTAVTGQRVVSLANEYGIPAELIAVDAVGLGSGTVDTARSLGLDVTEIIGGAKPVEYIHGFTDEAPEFNNLRSQMWYFLRTQMEAGRVAIAVENEDARRRLQEDLLAPRYRIGQDKRLEVEPKDSRSQTWGVKQRLGRSPDYGDMLTYGLFVEHVNTHSEVEILGTI